MLGINSWSAGTTLSSADPCHRVVGPPVTRSCPFQHSWNTEENHIKIGTKSLVHPIVDDGINTGVGHGQPVEAKVYVANVGHLGDGRVVVGVDEVDVVRSPAYHEDCNNHSKHFHQLQIQLLSFRFLQ